MRQLGFKRSPDPFPTTLLGAGTGTHIATGVVEAITVAAMAVAAMAAMAAAAMAAATEAMAAVTEGTAADAIKSLAASFSFLYPVPPCPPERSEGRASGG